MNDTLSIRPALEGALYLPSVSGAQGLNPLVRAANPVLEDVATLRALPAVTDLQGLRERLVQAIEQFQAQAQALGVDTQMLAAARYALCTLIDETVSSTPWGAGEWSSRSLLVTFHNENCGGERFFLILQRISLDPRTYVDLLELMYLCLALGLEGRYRVQALGGEQLLALRQRLLQMIQQQRGLAEADLSPRWRGVVALASRSSRVPFWGGAGLGAVALALLHLTCSGLLDRAYAPLVARMDAIDLAAPLGSTSGGAVSTGRVSASLGWEIAQGLLSVQEHADRSVIRLHDDGVFASGSARLSSASEVLLGRIGRALSHVQGEVLVVGHTDNVPLSATSRLGSNLQLSRSRAFSVMQVLAAHTGQTVRYHSEGRGEREPLVANDSAANRMRNRRVEIIVFVPAQAR